MVLQPPKPKATQLTVVKNEILNPEALQVRNFIFNISCDPPIKSQLSGESEIRTYTIISLAERIIDISLRKYSGKELRSSSNPFLLQYSIQ